jgi:ABC-type Fe3+ transport system substrate-binding protein
MHRPPDSLVVPLKRLRLRITALSVALLVLGTVLGCGSGAASPTPGPAPTPTPAPRPTAEPPASVGTWYAAAEAEAPVRIRADLTQGEIDALKKVIARRYPELEVEWRQGSDRELYQDTLVEARAGTANWDVYLGDSGPLLKSARIALRWTPPEARTVPQELIDPEGAWYAVAATYHVLQYHTDQVVPPAIPRTYEALQDPRFFGRLAIEDQNLTWLKGMVETRGRDATATIVQALAQQAVTFRRDARTLVVFVTAGQQSVAIDARLDVVERERRGGGKTAWVGVDPVIVQPLAMVVSATTDRPNGARLLGNFLLSADAQSIMAEAGRVPSRLDVETDPQTLVRGLQPRVILPAEGQAERELGELWQQLWGRR